MKDNFKGMTKPQRRMPLAHRPILTMQEAKRLMAEGKKFAATVHQLKMVGEKLL